MERSELKPCPACKSAARVLGETGDWCFGLCLNDNCSMQGPERTAPSEAAEAWNELPRVLDAPDPGDALLKEAGEVVVEMLVNSDLHPSVRRKSVYDRARALLAKLPKAGDSNGPR